MTPARSPRSAGPGPSVLAVDVGGTDLKVAELGRDGRLGSITRTPTPLSDTRPGEAVVEAIAALAAGRAVDALGVTVPGLVDEAAGVGIRSTNLGWRDVPFRRLLFEATGLPTAIAHDVRAAGEAEYRIGAARGFTDVAVVTIGTGIAASLRLNGRPYSGRGAAGELGHTVVDPDGPTCRCGNRGCLEAIASAGAIVRRYRERGGTADGAAEVLVRVKQGDAAAVATWEEALTALVTGLSVLSSLVAPEAIVVGGGLSEAGDDLLGPLGQRLREARGTGHVPVLARAQLGQDAGTWGAAFAARDLLTARTNHD